jgi:cation:H+ antiporter
VRGSIAIAERLGISPLLIGITVVGFGTSAPEMLVSIDAARRGSPEIALGNVVGSSIGNILLILGIAVLITPMTKWPRSVRRDVLMMTLVTFMLLGAVQLQQIDATMGLVFISILGVFLYGSYWLEQRDEHPTVREQKAQEIKIKPVGSPWLAALATVTGLGLLVWGASLLVAGAVSVARGYGLSEAVIGLTLVALGTSLPELATAIVAARRQHPDVVLGTVIGSNIFNVLAILGATALIVPIGVSDRFRSFDVPIMLGVSVGLLLLLLLAKRIGRGAGIVMLAAYIAYTTLLFIGRSVS